jgi:hypothetical protein
MRHFWILILGLFAAVSGLAQPTGAVLGEYLSVIGTTAAGNANRAENAQADAYRKALLAVAPVYVEARSSANLNELVSNYTYTEVRGFIEDSQPIGQGYVRDDIYFQPFKIKVNRGDLNLSWLKNKLDLKLLYDQVARPRICLAVEDVDVTEAGETKNPIHFSNGIVTKYFQSRHKDFAFKDLNLLRNSARQAEDLVREANNNSFDILIYGTSRYIEKKQPQFRISELREGNPGSIVDKVKAKGQSSDSQTWESEIQWQVINVSAKETIFVTQVFPGTGNQAPEMAGLPMKYGPVEHAASQLFRELLVYWNDRALNQKFEITFSFTDAPDTDRLLGKLRAVKGINANSVQLQTFEKSQIVFAVSASRPLAELISGLARGFQNEFKVFSSDKSQIKLSALNAPRAEITIRARGISLSEAAGLESELRGLQEIESVRKEPFQNKTATYIVKTVEASEALGLLLEKTHPKLKVDSVSDSALELHLVD